MAISVHLRSITFQAFNRKLLVDVAGLITFGDGVGDGPGCGDGSETDVGAAGSL